MTPRSPWHPPLCRFCQLEDHLLCDWTVGCECLCGLGLDVPAPIPTPRDPT